MRPSAAPSPGPVPVDQRDPSAFRMAQPGVNELVGDDSQRPAGRSTTSLSSGRPPAVDFQRLEARHDHFGGLGQRGGRRGRYGKLAAQGTLPLGFAQLSFAVLPGVGRRQAGQPTLIGGGPRRLAATALKSWLIYSLRPRFRWPAPCPSYSSPLPGGHRPGVLRPHRNLRRPSLSTSRPDPTPTGPSTTSEWLWHAAARRRSQVASLLRNALIAFASS